MVEVVDDMPVELLRFSKTRISAAFELQCQPKIHRIDEAVTEILEGSVRPHQFPPMEVVYRDGHFHSLDNRRLWIFKKAKVSSISVLLIHIPCEKSAQRFSGLNALDLVQIRRPEYMPQVLGDVRLYWKKAELKTEIKCFFQQLIQRSNAENREGLVGHLGYWEDDYEYNDEYEEAGVYEEEYEADDYEFPNAFPSPSPNAFPSAQLAESFFSRLFSFIRAWSARFVHSLRAMAKFRRT